MSENGQFFDFLTMKINDSIYEVGTCTPWDQNNDLRKQNHICNSVPCTKKGQLNIIFDNYLIQMKIIN